MSEIGDLPVKLRSFGYDLRQDQLDSHYFTATLTSGNLERIEAVLKADGAVCTVGILLGLLGAAKPSARYSLLVDALELNFSHSLARVSIFRIPPSDDPTAEESANSAVFVSETSFYWPDMTKDKFDARIEGMKSLGLAFSEVIASRDALLVSSPWYERLTGSTAQTPKS
jgi:hypothetical protein